MTRSTKTEIAIGILAVISIIIVAVESLLGLSGKTLFGIYMVDLVICIVFAWDFVHRLRSSVNKARFLMTNGYEILAMVPAIGLAALVALPGISAAFRSLRLVRVVRLVVVVARMRRVMATSWRFVRQSHLLTLFGIVVGIIFIGAFAVFILESGTLNAQIRNFPDALWWSISTVTTVGYGDIVPNSVGGRIMGMMLMVVGIGVMAAFISTVSSTLVESRIRRDIAGNDDLRATIVAEINSRINNIERLSESEVSLLIEMIQALRSKGSEA